MKKVALVVTVGLTLVLATRIAYGGVAATQSCTDRSQTPARMTVKTLHMWNQLIGSSEGHLAKGPIWDPYYSARPGQGKTMVVDAHDVTPVPGYGKHGPFYRLHLIRPGDLATIRQCGVTSTYRFVTKPFAKRQCASKRINNEVARLNDRAICSVPYDKPIKKWRGEVIYFRCCWPRYTRRDYLYVRAVLIKTRPTP